jgi:hypothetical protein
MEPQPVDSMVH